MNGRRNQKRSMIMCKVNYVCVKSAEIYLQHYMFVIYIYIRIYTYIYVYTFIKDYIQS